MKKLNIPVLDIKEVGIVKEVKHGIVKLGGLPNCAYGQLIQFSDQAKGMIIGFTEDEVHAIVFEQETNISVGDLVITLAGVITVPVGQGLLGRVVNSLGEEVDGKPKIKHEKAVEIFSDAPGIMDRIPLSEPLETGIKIIDLAIPIGKGQRELIIGDRQIGKTSVALDAIINQKGKDVICIFCWIGGPQAALKKHLYALGDNGALDYTIVVSSPANKSAAEQYLAPYTAAAIGEYFMHQGKDVLVVFDDLTKHAWVYRQMSLLLERAPGREAYPGDIFYLHSQLLERAARLSPELGGGSMTFLPIVETLQGDISGYIQTNLVSITDGQLYFNQNLFREGFRPAIDLGLSVSRIGSRVQSAAIKEVSGGLRLEYAQYREMLRLTKMNTNLSPDALDRLKRGEILTQLLTQKNCTPICTEEEVVLFYLFQKKIFSVIDFEMATKVINEFFDYFVKKEPEMIKMLSKDKQLSTLIKNSLDLNIRSFLKLSRDRNK